MTEALEAEEKESKPSGGSSGGGGGSSGGGSLGGGMLLFMMVSMITPLGSTFINVILCLAGGILFAIGLGAISKAVLKKTSLV